MPWRLRLASRGYAYHVLNRAVARERIFTKARDFEAFEEVIEQAKARLPIRVLAWCACPTIGISSSGRAAMAIYRSSCDG